MVHRQVILHRIKLAGCLQGFATVRLPICVLDVWAKIVSSLSQHKAAQHHEWMPTGCLYGCVWLLARLCNIKLFLLDQIRSDQIRLDRTDLIILT